MSDNRGSNLLLGFILGAAAGAGLTFLFGTKKGKEVRERIREKYPEVFDRLDEIFEGIEEKYEEISEEVKEMEDEGKEAVEKKVADLGKAVEKTRRFLKSGRKL